MPPAPTEDVRRRDVLAVHVLAALVVVLASTVLLGWSTGSARLTDLAPGLNPVKPNTAVCLLLLAASMLLRRGGTFAAALALGVVVLTAAAAVLGWGVAVDQAVVHVDEPGPHPGRMAAMTMVCLGLLALARLVVRRLPALSQAAAGLVLVYAAVAVLGYAYGIDTFYSTGRYSNVALLTAVGLLLVSGALVVYREGGPFHWLLHGDDAGAMLLRRMLPVLLVLVPLLGYVGLVGQRFDRYGTETGVAVMVTGCLTLVGAATWFVARRLAEHDAKLLQALATLSVVNHDLEARVSKRAVELEEERGRSAVLRDRNRIAADLHDHVIQTLFAVALQLQAEARRSDRPDPLVDASLQVDQAIRGLRSTIFELKRAGTAQALESDLAEIVSCSDHTEAEVHLRTSGRLASIPDEIAEHAVAVAREGLSNAVKHARARLITLEVDAWGEDLDIVVSDDGIGVDPGAATSGMRNLRERAVRLGGSCKWTRNETGGTTLTWRVPMSLTPGLAPGLVASAADPASDTLPAALAVVCAALVEDGPDALPGITQSLRAALDADLAVLLVGDGQEQVRILTSVGLPDDAVALGTTFDRRLSVAGHAMDTGQVLRLDNVTGASVPSRIFGSLDFASGLVVPVLGHEGGAALVVGRVSGSSPFSDLEEQHALALVSLLPLALDRASRGAAHAF